MPWTAIALYINFDMSHSKRLYWLGDSLDQVLEFAPEARERIGFELWEVQQGREPSDVLHAFTKKTPQPAKRDIDLAARRYRDLMHARTRAH
jgi:phage-related protein